MMLDSWKEFFAVTLGIPLAFSALFFLSGCATLTTDEQALKYWEPVLNEPEFVIVNLPAAQAQAACEVLGNFRTPEGWKILGCVDRLGPRKMGEACLIIMNGQLWRDDYEKILRHEKAHCRGWEHGQPVPTGDVG